MINLIDDYFDSHVLKEQDEVLKCMLQNNIGFTKNIIYPVHKNRLCGFLWRRTHWKCFLAGWKCNGKVFDKDTPPEEMKDPPEPIVFRRYIELPKIDKEEEEGQ